MSTPPTVKHWLLCRRARVPSTVERHNPYDLEGVCYIHRVDASIGMSVFDPLPLKTACLFARFYGGEGRCDFEIEVRWLDKPDSQDDGGIAVESYGPLTVYFREEERVRDFIFPLRNIPLCGVGRYEFRLLATDGDYSQPHESQEPMAVEHFEVVQP